MAVLLACILSAVGRTGWVDPVPAGSLVCVHCHEAVRPNQTGICSNCSHEYAEGSSQAWIAAQRSDDAGARSPAPAARRPAYLAGVIEAWEQPTGRHPTTEELEPLLWR